jgi:hypothetical protein
MTLLCNRTQHFQRKLVCVLAGETKVSVFCVGASKVSVLVAEGKSVLRPHTAADYLLRRRQF